VLAACSHSTQHRTMTISLVDGRPGILPGMVTVDKENQVIINVTNTTNAEHGFAIEGYGVETVVAPAQSEEIRFRASRGGTYRIYCQLHPMHQPSTLVVR
jgi:nitrosocyanin